MSELTFENTGIKKLDNLLYILEESSRYANDSTKWDEIDWQLYTIKGRNPLESIILSINDLAEDIKKHDELMAKLKRQGYIEE